MKSLHDNNIYSIEIRCEKKTILLHTEFLEGEVPEYTDVIFNDVIWHQFQHILEGNILFDIEEWPPDNFFKEYKETLNTISRYGFPLDFNTGQEFCDVLSKKNMKIFVINSSYGLSGWLIAENMKLLPRSRKK